MSLTLIAVQTGLLVAFVVALLWLRFLIRQMEQALASVRAERELIRRTLGLASTEAPIANTTMLGAALDRMQGFAPTAPWQVKLAPVDESIPPGAKLPTLEPGDRDDFELEPEAEPKIVSPLPPEDRVARGDQAGH